MENQSEKQVSAGILIDTFINFTLYYALYDSWKAFCTIEWILLWWGCCCMFNCWPMLYCRILLFYKKSVSFDYKLYLFTFIICWIYIRKYKLNYRWKFHASRFNFQGKNCKLMASIVDPACIFCSLSLVTWILYF